MAPNQRGGQKLYYQQAMKEISRSNLSPAYLLFGEEFLLGERIVRTLKQKFLGDSEPELNYFVRYATENGADAVISLGAGMGLFSDKKMIVLKEADGLKTADVERLIKFLDKLPNEICLVMLTGLASLYQSRLKKLEHLVTTVNLLPLRPDELNQYVQSEFQKFGKEITPGAVEMLLFLVGTQLSDLAVQVNNVAQYFADKELIEETDVEQIAGVYVTQDVFEYNRVMGEKDLPKAVFILHNLLDSGISPQQIVSQLIRHFSLVWRIRGYNRSGIRSSDVISRELKIYPRYFPGYSQQAQNWKSRDLKRVFSLLHRADWDLKNTNVNPKIFLDILSHEIINSK